MKKNSSNSTPSELQISDELKKIIFQYMKAYTNDDHAAAEAHLHKIRQLKEFLNESHD